MSKAKLALVALLLGSAIPGCATHGNADIASEAVVKFHHNLDRELYQEIMLDADPEYRANTFYATYLKRAREIGGKVKDSVGGRVASQAEGAEHQITMVYRTEFEHYNVSETFVFGVKDGKARLKFYEVNGLPGVTLN
jgi:hypothetical protein